MVVTMKQGGDIVLISGCTTALSCWAIFQHDDPQHMQDHCYISEEHVQSDLKPSVSWFKPHGTPMGSLKNKPAEHHTPASRLKVILK